MLATLPPGPDKWRFQTGPAGGLAGQPIAAHPHCVVEQRRQAEHAQAFGQHFCANTVAGDNGYFNFCHMVLRSLTILGKLLVVARYCGSCLAARGVSGDAEMYGVSYKNGQKKTKSDFTF